MKTVSNMIELLEYQSAIQPDKTVYSFLENGESITETLSYRQLDEKARMIAAQLQQHCIAGDRVLLLFPACLDYIAAFLACLYAGVIAVTAYPPVISKPSPRLASMVHDCDPKLILTTAYFVSKKADITSCIPELDKQSWYSVDAIPADLKDLWKRPVISPDSIAFLQYTSGSTSEPKGVMVSHANILHNEVMIKAGFGHDGDSTVFGWLPFYHDMGLIGNILQPLYIGSSSILMSPFSFLRNPMRWLKNISKYRIHTSGGPDFAFDLCTRSAKEEDLAELDLSSWKVAYNGSEPIRYETMKKFHEKFAPCGFAWEAFYPCYGLAEATLFVTGGLQKAAPVVVSIDKPGFEKNQIMPVEEQSPSEKIQLVSSGITWCDEVVRIVDADSKKVKADPQIGEIWVKNPSCAKGYWNNPEKTQSTFQAFTCDTQEGPFMRTGDLGFLYDNNLFVTGRIKEMIIVHGQNYYPHDLEAAIEKSHPSLRPGCGISFSLDVQGEERLACVQEINRVPDGFDYEEVFSAIRHQLSIEYDIVPAIIVLSKAGSTPKTTSGKKQRLLCKQMYLSNQLVLMKEYRETAREEPSIALSMDNLAEWFKVQLSSRSGKPIEEIDLDSPLTGYGIDSIKIMEYSHIIENSLGVVLPVESFFESNTVNELIEKIQALRLDSSFVGSKLSIQRVNSHEETILASIDGLSDGEIEELLLKMSK